jgi:hypothetical protein
VVAAELFFVEERGLKRPRESEIYLPPQKRKQAQGFSAGLESLENSSMV